LLSCLPNYDEATNFYVKFQVDGSCYTMWRNTKSACGSTALSRNTKGHIRVASSTQRHMTALSQHNGWRHNIPRVWSMWIRDFERYIIKMNVLQAFGSKAWTWQLKLRNKHYKITLYYKCALSQLCSLLRYKKFPSFYKCMCPTFNVRYGLLFRSLFLNITSSYWFYILIRQNMLCNKKWISPIFWSPALCKWFAHIIFSVLSIIVKSDDDQFLFFLRM